MSTSLNAGLWHGAPLYEARSGWRPEFAVAAVVVIFILAAGFGLGMAELISKLAGTGSLSDGAQGGLTTRAAITYTLIWQIGLQAGIVILTLIAARLFGGSWQSTLALLPARGGWTTYAGGFGVLVAVVMAYSVFSYLMAPDSMLSDLGPFIGMVRSDLVALLALVAVVGAPLSEELLFRGFLLSALAKTRLGFFWGALITTAAWAALHFNYSLLGLGAVFVTGLTLSWLLWRTGSLWVPIFCHALYNGLVLCVVVAVANSPAVT